MYNFSYFAHFCHDFSSFIIYYACLCVCVCVCIIKFQILKKIFGHQILRSEENFHVFAHMKGRFRSIGFAPVKIDCIETSSSWNAAAPIEYHWAVDCLTRHPIDYYYYCYWLINLVQHCCWYLSLPQIEMLPWPIEKQKKYKNNKIIEKYFIMLISCSKYILIIIIVITKSF